MIAALRFGTGARNVAVRETQEADVLRRKPEFARSRQRLRLTEAPEPVWRVGARARMRADAVAHDDKPNRRAAGAGLREEPSATEALVVGMRRDDNQPAAAGQVVERDEGQRLGGGQERIGPHGAQSPEWRQRSPLDRSVAST